VVIAMRDPNPHVRGGGSERLAAAGVDITFGVCQDQAEQLNEVFTTFVRTRRPFVIVKWAATLDGRIATRTGDARWVTGPASRAFVHRLRHAVDAIMVGVNTVIVDDPSLTTRIEGFTGKDPRRFILDSNLSLPENARVLHQPSEADTTVVTGPAADGEKRLRLERLGARILVAPLKDRRIDLRALMEMLGSESVTSVLIEGGSRVITAALRAEIVNKVMAFFAPKILGGDDGVPVCIGAGVQWMKDCRALTNVGVQRFEDDVMIEGYLKC
jgi:diaminohydroxyphosphoribosylaminopyrimidine deaminase/5-amino-6-(5-phosphoribosylamino)uracil reductase